MKFSVIIPVYNIEKYLPACMDSIQKQTFGDYEVILVDDGSTDSSGIICDKYMKQDARFHVIHQKNHGLSAARNRGIERAKGEYLLFLDSDDCYADKHCLEDIAKYADGCDIVAFDWMVLDEKSNGRFPGEGQTQGLAACYENGRQYLQASLTKKPLFRWYACIYAFRREFWIAQDFQFREGVAFEDLEIIYRVLLSANRIRILPRELYVYRSNRAGSITGSVKATSLIDKLETVRNNICQVRKNIQIPEDLRKALCNNFAVSYCSVIEYLSYVPNWEKNALVEEIRKTKWVGKYLTAPTFRLINGVANTFGVCFTSKLIKFGRQIKINFRQSRTEKEKYLPEAM